MDNSQESELPEPIRQALIQLRAGASEAARTTLIPYIRNNPNSEQGWYLLSQAVASTREQADCLRQVLRLNPNHPEAQARLQRLLEEQPPASSPAPAESSEPRAAETPESQGPPAPAEMTSAPVEPAAVESASAIPAPVEAQPGEESPPPAAEPAPPSTQAAPAPKPQARPPGGLSCLRILGAALVVMLITLGVLAAMVLRPWGFNPLDLLRPRPSPTISGPSPTPIRFPTLPPAWTATVTPTQTATPLPTETPTPEPMGFGTPVPGPGVAISAENVVSLTQVAEWILGEPDHSFTSLAVAPNGRAIAAGASDGTIRLWRAGSHGEVRVLRGHSQTVSSLAFSPDSTMLVSSAYDMAVRLWSVPDGMRIRTFDGHTAEVTSVAFAPDGQSIASGSLDGTARVWDVNSGNLRYKIPGKAAGLAFSPDGQMLAIAGENQIRFVRAESGEVRLTLNATTAAWERFAFSPDGKSLAISSVQAAAQVWQVADASLGRTFEAPAPDTAIPRLSDNVTFSPDGRLLASGTVDGRILVWQVSDGALKASLKTGAAEVLQVAFAPDDRALYSLSLDGTLRAWMVP